LQNLPHPDHRSFLHLEVELIAGVKKMKTLAICFLSLLVPLSTKAKAKEPAMLHETALSTYVEALNTHSWEQIAPHVAKDAVFIFTEDTFIGHAAAKVAFEKTFQLIQNEVFSLHDVSWTAVTENMAACHYEFRWRGLIEGQEAAGGGRGTSILKKVAGRWLIIHEHLGPYPRKP
jgi:ketosteroid isomerase-like protein